MFSAATHAADANRNYPFHHDRRMSHSGERLQYGIPPRPSAELPRELPRPLEPRPSYQMQPSLSGEPGHQRRPDAFRGPAPVQTDYRPQGPSLPRLQDILTSASPVSSHAAYPPTSWNGPTASQQSGDSYYGRSQAAWHPPLAPPPASNGHPYHAQQNRRVELPILETSPAKRHDSQVPSPPYAGYQDHPSMEYHDSRRKSARHSSTGGYLVNGAPSPYTTAGAEDTQYRSPPGSLDRPNNANFGQAGPESSKKYLGVREVPGEGAFHLYEGGYRIPTHVDGETVNPAWGLTKANKPRKRLAMACLDCREKKIKCEPGAASCLQCEKAKRVCRKAPTHQSQSETSGTPIWPAGGDSPTHKSAAGSTPPHMVSEGVHKRRTMDGSSPSAAPAKKHRSTSPLSAANGAVQPAESIARHTSPIAPRTPARVLCWEEDPYVVDPEATVHLLNYYFADVNDATYCIFPRHHFMNWLKTTSDKCQSERMVLYAMLAVGSIFSDDEYPGFAERCAAIAGEAIQAKIGRFSMCVVQTRLLLGMYHFAKGANGVEWDYIGAGIQAALYLRYHTESGCAEDDATQRTHHEFGFSREQMVECKRRTFWSGFLMDRYCGPTSSSINPQDVFLRLPCFEETYERGFQSDAPHYNNGTIDPLKASLTATSAISPMGWLILVAGIWGDVVNFIYRAVHRSPVAYAEEYEKFYDVTRSALQNWSSRLPDQLQFSQANVERSIRGGYAGPFISMHVLYHLAWVKMNRFVRHSLIPKSLARNVRASHKHSHDLLQVMSTLRAAKWHMVDQDGHAASFSFTTPFAGYAILAAIDVVGAGGLDSNLKSTLELISCGLESLRELARYWNSARDQDKACEKRYYQIHNVLKHPFTARSGCWLGREWGVHSSLEREFAEADDCIYGADDRSFFDALRDDPHNSSSPISGMRAA